MHTFSVKLSIHLQSWTWTMTICEERSWSLNVPLSLVSLIVTGTCTHLEERGYLLCFHDYLLSRQILRGGSQRLKSNQTKTREDSFHFFLPRPGLSPGPFSSNSSALPSEPSHLVLQLLVILSSRSFWTADWNPKSLKPTALPFKLTYFSF